LKNIVSTKNISALFLADILIAGTITTFSPTFMLGAVQAQPNYGIDKDRKQDVSIVSLKCDNINVNVNGLELDVK
jgi:hypothetical protein